MKTLNNFSYSILFSLLFQIFAIYALGQENRQFNKSGDAKVTGVIIDAANNQPIPYASVVIFRVNDSTLISGAMTKDDGSFTIEELPYGKFYIEVTFLGYKKQKFNSILLTPNKKISDMGSIKINPLSTTLNEVVVVGNTPPVQYRVDKKVIDISQNITAAGGTVADALQNAPSVQTDVQGNVTLRGSSNFIVLIDGKPSPISGSEALQQLPANLVQSVEIITNPSAKYEAEGSAGIINVIMKKQKIQGASGIFSATAGTGDKYGANLNLNYKVSKFNFSLGADFTDMKYSADNYISNIDTLGNQLLKKQFINGSGNFRRKGMGITGGVDYALDNKNSISLTGGLGNRSFSRPQSSSNNDEYINLLNPAQTDIYYLNSNTPEFKRNYYSVNLDYQLKLNDKGHQLSASANFTGGPDDNLNNLWQDTTDANWNSLGKSMVIQQSAQNSNETQLKTKIDYALPVGDKSKMEAGYQGTYSGSNGNSYVNNYIANSWVADSSQTDHLKYRDQIQAGYVTFSGKIPVFEYLLGLRSEYENRLLNEVTLNEQYKVNRIDFFPSVHLSKQLPWNFQLQASYTRRINRPRDYYMNPFVIHINPQTIRKGNPGLLPEFANSYELNIQKKFSNSSFISLEGYMRQTSNLIQQINTFDAATQINTSTFSNIDHDRSIGAEFMIYLEPSAWFTLNSSFNVFNYHMFGSSYFAAKNNTNTWNVRISPTLRISKYTGIQLSYAYNAPTITAQGTRSGYYFSSLGIRQSLFKQKGSLTLQVRDLWGQPNFASTTESTNQYSYSNFKRESKVFLLTFSFRINNYKTKQTKRNPDDTSGNEGQDMEQGM